jgi:nucleoid-associated protein YgaU
MRQTLSQLVGSREVWQDEIVDRQATLRADNVGAAAAKPEAVAAAAVLSR